MIFAEKNRNYFSQTLPDREKLKSAKNNHRVFETKPRKFGDAKISHYTVFEVEGFEMSRLPGPVSSNRFCCLNFANLM